MARIIDFPDGFTSATEPTTGGAIASFAEVFANDAAYEAVYGAGVSGSFYFNSTLNKLRIHDGTDWRTNERALDGVAAIDPTINEDSDDGYEVLSLWLNTSSGALFRAVDVTVGAAVWTELAADAVLDSHMTDTSTHGVTEIVGTTETQTLTNKTLTAPSINGGDIDGGTASNTNRITIPSETKANLDGLTRKAGTVVYATDESKFYLDNGTDLTEVSGSGGGSGLDNWLAEDFETTLAADFSSGNNATFGGAGAISGVLSDETTSPMSGISSLKYVAGVSSLNDYFASPVIEVDPKQQENDSGFTFYFTWDGTTDIEAVIWDETNSAKLSSVLDVVNTADGATRYSATFYPPSTCTQVKWGFHFLVAPTSGDVLIVDDVQFSTDPFSYKELLEEQTLEYYETGLSISVGTGGVLIDLPSITPINYFGADLIGVTNETSSTRFTAKRNLVLTMTSEGRVSVTNGRLQVYKNGVKIRGNGGESTAMMQSHVLTLVAGDYVELDYLGSASTITEFSFGFHAQAETEHVITPAKSNMTDWIAYTPTTQSYGTISADEFYYKQVGDTYHLHGKFTAGTVDGTEAQIGLPNSHTIKSGTAAKVVGYFALGGVSTATVSVVATGGDAFVNFGRPDSGTATIPQVGTSVANTGLIHSFYATVPIEELSSDATFLAAVPVQKVAFLKDVKATGVQGGTLTSGSYVTRDLNTVEGDSSIVSLSANQFTLGTGSYLIEAESPAFEVGRHQSKIVDITNTVDYLGSSEFSAAADNITSKSKINAYVTIITSSLFDLKTQVETTKATNGGGVANSFGDDEVYTQVKITKLR